MIVICVALRAALSRTRPPQVAQHTGADVVTVCNDYFFGDDPPERGRVPHGRWVPLGAAPNVRPTSARLCRTCSHLSSPVHRLLTRLAKIHQHTATHCSARLHAASMNLAKNTAGDDAASIFRLGCSRTSTGIPTPSSASKSSGRWRAAQCGALPLTLSTSRFRRRLAPPTVGLPSAESLSVAAGCVLGAQGGFPEDYGYAMEDWELFAKTVLSGYKARLENIRRSMPSAAPFIDDWSLVLIIVVLIFCPVCSWSRSLTRCTGIESGRRPTRT